MVLLARILGAEGRGLLAAILVYPQIMLALSEGGMRQAAINFIGQKKATDAEILSALIAYILIAGSIGYAAVFCLIYFFGNYDIQLTLIFIAAAILPFTLIVNALQGFLLGKEDINKFNKAIWIQKVLYVCALFLLYLLDNLTVTSALLITCLAAFFNVIQMFIYFKREYKTRLSMNWSVLANMFKAGLVYALAFFLIQANYKLDILLLSWMNAGSSVGEYVVSLQIGELLWQLPGAVLIILISKSANSNSKDMINSLCKTVRITFFVTFILSLGLLLATYYLAVPVFGNEYSNLFTLILLLCPGLVFATLFKTLNAYYAGQGKPQIALLIMFCSVFVNVVVNIILIPKYGASGAAIASSISYVISGVFIVLIFSHQEKISIRTIILISGSDLLEAKKMISKKKLRKI